MQRLGKEPRTAWIDGDRSIGMDDVYSRCGATTTDERREVRAAMALASEVGEVRIQIRSKTSLLRMTAPAIQTINLPPPPKVRIPGTPLLAYPKTMRLGVYQGQRV